MKVCTRDDEVEEANQAQIGSIADAHINVLSPFPAEPCWLSPIRSHVRGSFRQCRLVSGEFQQRTFSNRGSSAGLSFATLCPSAIFYF